MQRQDLDFMECPELVKAKMINMGQPLDEPLEEFSQGNHQGRTYWSSRCHHRSCLPRMKVRAPPHASTGCGTSEGGTKKERSGQHVSWPGLSSWGS